VLDSVTFGSQTTDVSYGHFPDGAGTWFKLSTPTPGAGNIKNGVAFNSDHEIPSAARR